MTWTPWNGGKCPVEPETVVEVEYRDGCIVEGSAVDFAWAHLGGPGDVAAYRVADADRRTTNHGTWVVPRAGDPDKLTSESDPQPPEKPFSTRITEAEEKALEAVDFIHGALNELESAAMKAKRHDAERAIGAVTLAIVEARATIATAAALARDYARKEA